MDKVPASLQAVIRRDLRPVRRLAPPAQRVLWLTPLAVFTLVAASRVFSLRQDATVLGWGLTWGTSLLQTIVALVLIALALRDAVPGRSLGARVTMLVVGAVAGLSAVVTLRTWSVSPTTIDVLSPVVVGEICFTGTLIAALPLLVASAVLAHRAFSVRPWSSGALYGLGAGLGADAGWRLFCHFSDPAHVFPTHTGAVLTVALLGMLVARATVWVRFRRIRRRASSTNTA
jgi:Negative regulator of sigma F